MGIFLKTSLRLLEPNREETSWVDAVEFAREKLGFEADATQEMVLRGGRRGIVNCTRQWGKSAAKAVHRAYTEPESLTLVLSPSGRQSGEFLRKAEAFVRRLGIRVRGDGANEISLELPNRSRIVGLPGNERTSRGFSKVSLLLIDEAARVPDVLYRAMRPSLAACDGDLWLMSTANGRQGFSGRSGSEAQSGNGSVLRRRIVQGFRSGFWRRNGREAVSDIGRTIFVNLWIGRGLFFLGNS